MLDFGRERSPKPTWVRMREPRGLGAMAAIGCLALLLFRIAACADETHDGTWTLRALGADNLVDLEISYRSPDGGTWDEGRSMSFDPRVFPGLNPADLHGGNQNAHFRIRRDAGSLLCDGAFARGVGSGVWTYQADPRFAAELQARGLETPSSAEQFEMTIADVSLAMIDTLRSSGVSGITTSGLARFADHGVDADYIRSLAAAGVKPAAAEDYVDMRDHGVTADFASTLARYGYHPGADELIQLRDHGVTTEFVSALQRSGYHPIVDDLARLRDHGVTSDFVAGLQQDGYRPTVDDLVRLRDHGVTLDFVARLRAHGYQPSIDDLIRLRDSGM
jgi:hypothetical protein